MEGEAHREGQTLIRGIIDEYRNLLESLEDPQILLNGKLQQSELGTASQQNQGLTGPPVSSILKLSNMFSKLRECYNVCIEENHFGVKEDESKVHSGFSAPDNEVLAKSLQKQNSHLKRINNSMQQLIWDIDKMKNI